MLHYISDNYYLLVALAGLWMLLNISAHISRESVRMTRFAVVLLLLNSILIHVEMWLGNLPTFSIWRPMLAALIYIFNPMIMVFIIQIITPERKKHYWLLLPLLINVPVCLSSQWTHLVFFYHPKNYYAGGLLPMWPYYVFAFYVVVFLVRCWQMFHRSGGRERMMIPFIVFSGTAGVVLAIVTQSTSDYSGLFATELLLYYLFLYIQMARIDPLTHLQNRQSYIRDIREKAGSITAVVSADMNELKWVNDTQGHDAGDAALQTVATCLFDNRGGSGTVYRTGGDEFLILYYEKDADKIRAHVEAMRGAMAKTPFTCAFGCAIRQEGETVEAAEVRADKEMYEDKARMKAAILAQGGTLHDRQDSPAPTRAESR